MRKRREAGGGRDFERSLLSSERTTWLARRFRVRWAGLVGSTSPQEMEPKLYVAPRKKRGLCVGVERGRQSVCCYMGTFFSPIVNTGLVCCVVCEEMGRCMHEKPEKRKKKRNRKYKDITRRNQKLGRENHRVQIVIVQMPLRRK
jgi:hypothetical protein